jgi:hypothetical protein
MFDAKSYIHNKEMNNGLESRDLYPSTILCVKHFEWSPV